MKVKITYSPNLDEIGQVKDLDVDEARVLIRASRAVAYNGDDASDSPETVDALVKAHSKDELIELAADRGVDVDPQATKADIASQVLADAVS